MRQHTAHLMADGFGGIFPWYVDVWKSLEEFVEPRNDLVIWPAGQEVFQPAVDCMAVKKLLFHILG